MDAPGAAGLTAAALDERAAGALRTAGLRVTRPRLAVHRALAHLGGHRTADEVTDALRQTGEALPRASVYNALDALRAAGLVMQAGTGSGGGAARYEVAATWHHHFVCRLCGAVSDVACAVGTKPCLDPHIPGVDIEEAEVTYRGVCAGCRSDA